MATTRRTKQPGVPAERIEIDSMLLANSVEVREGMLFMLGGGWMRCWPLDGQFPFDRALPLAVLLRVPYHETNREHTFTLSIRDSDEQQLGGRAEGAFKVGRDTTLTDGMSQLVPMAVVPSVKLERTGIYCVVLEVDGQERKRIAFEVIPAAPR